MVFKYLHARLEATFVLAQQARLGHHLLVAVEALALAVVGPDVQRRALEAVALRLPQTLVLGLQVPESERCCALQEPHEDISRFWVRI